MSTLLSTRDRNTLFMCLVVGRYAADCRLQYGDNIASEQPVQMVLVVVLVLVQYYCSTSPSQLSPKHDETAVAAAVLDY